MVWNPSSLENKTSSAIRAYLSLGYVFGIAIEAAADFTSSLSGLLVSLVILAALGFMIQQNQARLTTAKR